MTNFLFPKLFDAQSGLVIPEALDERVALMICTSEPPTDLQICNIMLSFSAVKFPDTLASLKRLRMK